VVGSDKSAEAPPGVPVATELFHEDVAVLGTTLSGLCCLSERSVRRSGDIGSPLPPRRFDDREVFRRLVCRAVRRPPGGSHRLGRPLRVRAPLPSPVLPDRVAPPGVPPPSSDFSEGIRITRAIQTRHRPSSGFLTPSTGCSPSSLADSLGPLPLMGFSLVELFRADRLRRVAAPLAPSRPRCSTASNSEEYEVESSAASKALELHLPWSHGRGSRARKPPSKHMIPEPSQGLSPPLVPSRA